MSAPPRSTSWACRTCSCRPAAARFPKRRGASKPACSTCASARASIRENPRGVEISEGVLYRATHRHPQPGSGRHLHRRDLPDRQRPGARRRDPRHRDRQERLRALRRPCRPPPRLALRPGLGAPVARPRLGRRRRVQAALLSQILTRSALPPALTISALPGAEAWTTSRTCAQFVDELSSFSDEAARRKRGRAPARALPPIGKVVEIAGSGSRIRMDARDARRAAVARRPVGGDVRPGRKPGQDDGRQQLADRQRPHAVRRRRTAKSSPTSTSSAKARARRRAA